MTDPEIALGASAGTPAWFSAELARAQFSLYTYVRTLLAGSPDAWDVLQEANRVMCQKAADVGSAAEFLPWAYTVARYEVMTHRKRMSRDRLVFSAGVLDSLAARASTVSTGFADRTAALENCLKKLPERQRQYVALRYSDALSVGEIARRVARAENAVAAALYRARTALARCIEAALSLGGGDARLGIRVRNSHAATAGRAA